ncbi:MAG TPA: cobyrinate a,c-diamide synthase [Puia sp.]|jgi:cobyrinic acid a,c-diamide synthase
MNSQFLLAAAHSGAGKTTVTLGLLRALQRKDLAVQPFKCGPDYIDPIHHRTAAGKDSINLDRFMMSDTHIRKLYDSHGSAADVVITEGVMGLFDGAKKSEGSSADIAKLLGLPVILVVNAKAMAYSAAALLYGLKNFDTELNVAGVIFNFVDTESHYRLLCEAGEDVGIKALGHLPVNDSLRIPSRHLGLDTTEAEAAIVAAADHIEKHIDLEALLALTRVESSRVPQTTRIPIPATNKKILVAYDEAFHFLYPENIRRLEEYGQVSYFSPIRDRKLPFIPDLLYLPGGYPELYLPELSANGSLIQQVKAYAASNRPMIAECGGMMYLGREIQDVTGKAWPMAGVLDIASSIFHKKMTLGYRTVRLGDLVLKGHEFHYSQLIGAYARSAAEVCNVQGIPVETPVFYHPHLLASYAHFYWGENKGLLQQLLS